VSLLVIVTLGCSAPAPASGVAAVLSRADTDHDGTLSPAEYTAVDSAAGFLELDADRDGAVRLDELDAWLHLAEPRPEDQAPNPTAIMDALQAAAVAATVVAPPAPVPPPPGVHPAGAFAGGGSPGAGGGAGAFTGAGGAAFAGAGGGPAAGAREAGSTPVATIATGRGRGKPPKPDPSVILMSAVGLAWGFAAWATARSLPGAAP